MDAFVVIAVSAVTAIATLVLISTGLAVIFGLMRVVNMAHGEFLMVGALTTTSLVLKLHFPWWLAMMVAPFVGATIGGVMEVLLISRIYQRQLVDTLLITFGISLVMFQLAVDVFGTTPPGIETPLGAVTIGSYSFPAYTLVMLLSAIAMLAGLYLLFTRTKYGLLARATAQNPTMALALGVPAQRINFITFTLGCALASLGGAILAPMISVSPSLGQAYVGQAFMAVVIAGPAFISGTLLSAILLGGVSNALSQGATTLWGVTGLFAMAIVILRFKPFGVSFGWKRGL
ncbi:branched-subunit amino acid ABC-type transport system permease component [Bradyrhizobium sp. USDA 4011]